METATGFGYECRLIPKTKERPGRRQWQGIETFADDAISAESSRTDGDIYVCYELQSHGYQEEVIIGRILTVQPASPRAPFRRFWWATSSDLYVTQNIGVWPSSVYDRDLVEEVIGYFQGEREYKIADRLAALRGIVAIDEQDPMDEGSLRVALTFIDQRRRQIRAEPGGLPNVVGVGYPAIWLTGRGEIQLLWETEDLRVSIIITCLLDGQVRLDIHDEEHDRSFVVPHDDALMHSESLLGKIR